MSGWAGSNKDNWIAFSGVNGLTVDGIGQIDGQGNDWWNSCRAQVSELNSFFF